MARRGRPTVPINLSGDERKTLERSARRHNSSQALVLRCRIVLACAQGDRTHARIATDLGCNPVTVTKWRQRFARDRLDGLVDAPRPGAARTIGDDVVEAVVVDTLETAPPDATHWSTRGLAAKHGISHTTVSEIWRAFGLKPWRQDEFKVSPDPDLVDKIRDLVDLYNEARLQALLAADTTFESFFAEAALNPNASSITGAVCGVRVEEVDDPLMRKIRYLDKLVDELAKGRPMEKVLRT